MVWFIHDRFGMVCSTTTCSKIKRKWLKVIEAEERGEHLDPMEAQEQVRQEALRVGKNGPSASRRQRKSDVSAPSNDLQIPVNIEAALQQQQPLPEYDPQIDQHLQDYKPQIDQHLQEQLQTEVAHAALHQNGL